MAIKDVMQDKTWYNDPLDVDWMMDGKAYTYLRVQFCDIGIDYKLKEELGMFFTFLYR